MKRYVARWGIYLLGTAILAFGLTLNTKTELGTSCVMVIPYTLSQLFPISIGAATLVIYALFIFIQLLLHWRFASKIGGDRKRLLLVDILQMGQNLIFSWLVGLYSDLIPVLSQRWPHSFPGTVTGRALAVIIAIVCTGVGAAMVLNMRLVPNPADGVVQTIADVMGRSIGGVKTGVDVCCICIAAVMGLMVKGRIVGIGVGTLAAALGIGRVIGLTNRLGQKKMCRAAGLLTD